ncbi:MAG: phosphoglucosamine mutase, partial [Candidatus Neomarinimicrobiota bacterium]
AVNGAGSLALPALLEALGCAVVRLHTTPNGEFPRGPEPSPENLTALSEAVTAEGAHLGMATDPDGDRLALLDETGTPAGEELTQVLAVDGYLQRTHSRQPVVTNLSSSQLLDHVAGRHGAPVVRAAVGEVNVVARMRAEGSEIGGEGNGGVILAESHLGRDALVGAALVLDRLVQDQQPLSGILADLPKYVMLKERIPVDGLSAEKVYQDVSRRFPDGEHITEDGLKVQWEDRWFHIRESNTEPIIRIYAEGPTMDVAREMVASVRSICAAAGTSP